MAKAASSSRSMPSFIQPVTSDRVTVAETWWALLLESTTLHFKPVIMQQNYSTKFSWSLKQQGSSHVLAQSVQKL